MKTFFIFSGQILKKTFITLRTSRLKLNSLNQTGILSKSIMQLAKTTFSDSVMFIEKKRLENRLWAKSEFLWANKFIHHATGSGQGSVSVTVGPASEASGTEVAVKNLASVGAMVESRCEDTWLQWRRKHVEESGSGSVRVMVEP